MIADLIQETFLRVLKALPTFEGRSRLSTWISQIAICTAVDALRKRAATTRLTQKVAAMPERSVGAEHVERLVTAAAIQGAVDELTPEVRAVFLLRVYHDRDYKDIAKALNVSMGTVKSRLWRARQVLMTTLEDRQ